MNSRVKLGVITPLVLLLLVVWLFAGCAGTSGKEKDRDEKIILPPVRVGKTQAKALLLPVDDLDKLLQDTDAVAYVRIGNWLGEDLDSYVTAFRVEAIHVLRGTLPKHFALLQDGCSEVTEMGLPLYTHGMEMLIFLTNHDPWIEKYRKLANGEELYTSSGGVQTVMHSIGDGKGEYVYTHWELFANSLGIDDVAVETLKREGYYDGLAKKMGMDDPSLTEIEIEERTPLVFRVQDIADRIKDN